MKKITPREAYQLAGELALDLHRSIRCTPGSQDYELAMELRHTAQDTAMNLSPDVEREDGIDAACGSVARLEYGLILARDLGLFPKAGVQEFQERAADLGRRLQKMNSKLRA
ncbi:MAG TPA: four helix bundle protein [Planctomycetota bacterium]|nr:four helix bundle protein [Planctomycetota bacterium]